MVDVGERSTVTTDDGSYALTDLPPLATYTVREVLQNGWTQTAPAGDGTHSVFPGKGELVTGEDFGNRALPGQITGQKFHDLDSDGMKDPGEPPLAGWTIFLDTNENGSLDNGEVSTTTDANGDYSFTGLEPLVTYTVAEQPQVGWTQTTPKRTDFVTGTGVATEGGNGTVIAGDFDEDGLEDLVVTEGFGRLSIFINNGDGSFDRTRTGEQLANGLTKGDFNGDGHLDLVVGWGDRAYVMLGDGQGDFTVHSVTLLGFGTPTPVGFLAADINGDGNLDVVALNNNSRDLTFLTNDGTGVLTKAGELGNLVTFSAQSAAVGDITGDGRPDLIVAIGGGGATLYANDGSGGFGFLGQIVNVQNARSVLLADVDGDGDLDAVIADVGTNEILVSHNDGLGSFAAPASVAVGSVPTALTTIDADSDGDLDLAVTTNGSNGLSLLVNDGTGSFSLAGTFATGISPVSIVAADFDGDDLPDLGVSNDGSLNVSLLLNRLQLTHSIVVPPGTVVADQNFGNELTLVIDDPLSVTETNGATSVTFTVTLSAPSSVTTTVQFATASDTATAGADFVTQSGSVTFDPGQTSKPIVVTIVGDTVDEFDEQFVVNLSAATNARIVDDQGRATITDDDAPPTLSINDATLNAEGDEGLTGLTFTVTLSAASAKPISVNYNVFEQTALAISDYSTTNTFGTLNFSPGTTTRTIQLFIQGDQEFEPDETFLVQLSAPVNATLADRDGIGTIRNDDPLLTVNSVFDRPDLNPGNFTVDTDVQNEITLRAAIMEANALPGPDTIILPAGTYRLTRSGSGENGSALGDLDITSGGLTIIGAGADVTIIDASGLAAGMRDRVFDILQAASLHLSGVTIRGGEIASGAGGGIRNAGSLTITDATLTGNRVLQGAGGGIDNSGTLVIESTQFHQNTATEAGAISNNASAMLTISGSLLTENRAVGNTGSETGGAIVNVGQLQIDDTILRGNTASLGGAVFNFGTITVSDSTFDGNQAQDGGAIYNFAGTSNNVTINSSLFVSNGAAKSGGAIYLAATGSVRLINSTFSKNTANQDGGAIANTAGSLSLLNTTLADNRALAQGGAIFNSASADVTNTLIARNAAPLNANISGAYTSLGNNLIGVLGAATGFSDGINGDLVGVVDVKMVTELEDNGGPTLTYWLLPGSPAIDAANTSLAPNVDQRGGVRPQDGDANGSVEADIGAFELPFNRVPDIADQTFFVDENASINLSVGTIVASDPDSDTLRYELISGNVGGAFTLDEDTGMLRVSSALNYEVIQQYQLTIQVRDPGRRVDSATVTIDINDINESPFVIGNGISDLVRPDSAVAETVELTTVFADPDGDTLTFEVVNTNPNLLNATIVGSTLQLSYQSQSYRALQDRTPALITVNAFDPDDLSVQESFKVIVTPHKTFEYVLVVVIQPTPDVEVTTLPTSVSSASVGDHLFGEIWMRDLLVGSLLASGVESVGVRHAGIDVTFSPNVAEVLSFSHTGILTGLGLQNHATIDNEAGRIEQFAAQTLPANATRGVAPTYGRLGYFEFEVLLQQSLQLGLELDAQLAAQQPTERIAASPAGGVIDQSQIRLSVPIDLAIDPEGGLGATTLFGAPLTFAIGAANPVGIIATDIDRDGDRDLVSITDGAAGGAVVMLLNSPGFSRTLHLAAGEIATSIDFGDQAAAGAIRGQNFNDLNRNGQRDLGEPGLEGWTVYLDLNGNNERDNDEPSRVTDQDGLYSFSQLPALTNYIVREETLEGWVQTFPSEPNDREWSISLAAGENRGDVDFGNSLDTGQGLTDLVGRSYRDVNGNGTQDAGEFGIQEQRIYIDLNNNGSFDANEPSTLTDAAGEYRINSLSPSTYFVRAEPLVNETQTFPLGNRWTSKEVFAGDGPQFIQMADVNGDTYLDLVIANRITNNVSILMNDNQGTGAFEPAKNISVGFGASSVVVADLDGDGDGDIAASNLYSASVTILINGGSSGFTKLGNFPVGFAPRSLVAADLNDDGKIDLAVASEKSNAVTILLNDGQAHFANPVNIPVLGAPVGLTVANLDGVAGSDIAVVSFDSNKVTVLPNRSSNGTLLFGTPTSFNVGSGPFSVTNGDFDRDGDLDLAVANVLSDNVSILLNLGNGLFAPATNVSAGTGPSSLSAVDLDRDGDLDLAVTNGTSTNLAILRNLGTGKFSAPETFGAGDFPTALPFAVAAGDINGDNSIDLAVANSDSDNISLFQNSLVPGAHIVQLTSIEDAVGLEFRTQSTDTDPTLAALPTQVALNEEAGVQTLPLTGISDGDSGLQPLRVTATSSNSQLISMPLVNYSSPNSTGSITYQPNAGQSGQSILTITVTDGGIDRELTTTNDNRSISWSVTINVLAVNDPPAIDGIGEQAILEDAGPQAIGLTGISAGDLSQFITITATSSNPSLIPHPTINYSSPNAVGSLSYQPLQNQSGTSIITITVKDDGGTDRGGIDTTIVSFTVTVSPVNDPPKIDSIGNKTLQEDAGSQTVGLTGISAGDPSQFITITATSSNPSLIPHPTINYSSPNAVGSLSYQPLQNQSGTSIITITVKDDGGTDRGGMDTTIVSFTVTVSPANDPPTIDAIADPASILEDGPTQVIELNGITAGGNESQPLQVTVTSSNIDLIPTPMVSYTSPNTMGSVSYSPTSDRSGTSVLTVTVTDGGLDGDLGTSGDNASVARQFTVTVLAANDPPKIDSIGDKTLQEDAGSQTVGLTGISAGDQSQFITITATSSNPSLIPHPTINYSSPNAVGSLSYQPLQNQSGTSIITITVKDDGGTDRGGIDTTIVSFTVTVSPVNDPPTIDAIADPVAVLEDSPGQTIALTGITAGGNESQPLRVSVTSSNTALIPVPTFAYTSPETSGSVTYQPIAKRSGLSVISVTVTDGGLDENLETPNDNGSTTKSFTVVVNASNHEVTLDPIANPAAIKEDAGEQTISLSGISAGLGEDQPLRVTVLSDNPDLILPAIDYASPASTGTITYTPQANLSGSAVVTVTVTDGGLDEDLNTANDNASFSRAFTVTVLSVNDPPMIAAIGLLTILEDAGQQSVSLSGISAGDEFQGLALTASSSNPSLVADPVIIYTSGDTTGLLTYASSKDQFGIATITLTLIDDGGVENGGVDTLVISFTIEVSGVNDPPVAEDNVASTDEDTPIVIAAATLLGNDRDPDDLDVLTTGLAETTSQRGAVIRRNEDGSFSYDPSSVDEFQQLIFGETLEDRFTYLVMDGQEQAIGTVVVTVSGVLDYVNPINPRDVNKDGTVAPLDVLIIINTLNLLGTRPLRGISGPPEFYYDVSGDNTVAPIDVLQVINFLNSPLGEAEESDWDVAAPLKAASTPSIFVMLDIRQIELVAQPNLLRVSKPRSTAPLEVVRATDAVLATLELWNHNREWSLDETLDFEFETLSEMEIDELLSSDSVRTEFQ